MVKATHSLHIENEEASLSFFLHLPNREKNSRAQYFSVGSERLNMRYGRMRRATVA